MRLKYFQPNNDAKPKLGCNDHTTRIKMEKATSGDWCNNFTIRNGWGYQNQKIRESVLHIWAKMQQSITAGTHWVPTVVGLNA